MPNIVTNLFSFSEEVDYSKVDLVPSHAACWAGKQNDRQCHVVFSDGPVTPFLLMDSWLITYVTMQHA